MLSVAKYFIGILLVIKNKYEHLQTTHLLSYNETTR